MNHYFEQLPIPNARSTSFLCDSPHDFHDLFPPPRIFVRTVFGIMNPLYAAGDFSVPMFVESNGNEWLSAQDLVDQYGLDYDKLRKRLERFRKKAENSSSWRQLSERFLGDDPEPVERCQ